MLSLVLSKGVQLKGNSAHRIHIYSLYYCMLKQVLELTFSKYLTPRKHRLRCERAFLGYHVDIFYEITNRCSYMQSILFHC